MPSTYTPNLGLEQPATGEQAGVWGNTVNNTFSFLDTGIDGSIWITLSATGYTLQTNQGIDSEARNKVINFKGGIAGPGTITISPNSAKKIYFVSNQTTGGFSLTFTQGSGGGFVLENGRSAVIYADGTGSGAKVTGALADLQVNSLLVQTSLIVQGQITWGSGAVTISQPATFNAAVNMTQGATISPSLTLNVGGDQPYDLHYRSTAGPLARLPIGTVGQSLTAGAAGPVWATISAAINMVIAGAQPNQIFFANNAQQMVQDPGLSYTPSLGLGIGMPPQNGGLTLGRGMPALIILDTNTNPPQPRTFAFTTNLTLRWRMSVDLSPETGGNVGSVFKLQSFDDPSTTSIDNFASFRSGRSVFGASLDTYGAQLAVTCYRTTDIGLVVRGHANQTSHLQHWQNSLTTAVATMDNDGNLFCNSITTNVPIGGGGGGGLSLNAQKRLEIGVPVASGHPLGTLHVGVDTSTVANCSIAMEKAQQRGNILPTDVGRIFFYRTASNFSFVIEYTVGGNQWYASLPLVAGGAPNWQFNTIPM